MSSTAPPDGTFRRATSLWLRALAGLGCASAAATATAAEFSIGVGAGATWGRGDCVASFACDRDNGYAKAFATSRLSDEVDLRAVLFDARRFEGGDTTPLGTAFGGRFGVRGFGLAVGYRWPLAPSWRLDAWGGLAAVRTRFDYVNPAYASQSRTTVQPLVGASLGYTLGARLRLSLEYEVTRFEAHTRPGSLQMLGLAAQVTF